MAPASHTDNPPVEGYPSAARVRALQKKTGGFTEFVPLPFVHSEAPIYLKGRARRGRPASDDDRILKITRRGVS